MRGTLLLAITCSHALVNLQPGYGALRVVASYALSGSAGFATLSGLMVGWFAVTRRESFHRVTHRYRVQAMRLVLVHPLLALLVPSTVPALTLASRSLFMTDTLAVLFVLAVPLVPRIGARTRVHAGIGLIAVGALLRSVEAANPVARVALDLLDTADPSRAHVLLSSYGLLPTAGMFLIGSWLGESLARAQEAGEEHVFVAHARRARRWLAMLGCALVVAWLALRSFDHELARVVYPDYESALYPIYLAITMWLLTSALAISSQSRLARPIALLGRHSLAVYVGQYVIVQTLPQAFGMSHALSPLGWLALCGIAIVLLPGLAAALRSSRRLARAPRQDPPG